MAAKRPRGSQFRSLTDFFTGLESNTSIQAVLRELKISDEKERHKLFKILMFLSETMGVSIGDVRALLNKGEAPLFACIRKGAILRMLSLGCSFSEGHGTRKVEDTAPFFVRMMSSGGLTKVVVKCPTHERKRFSMDATVDLTKLKNSFDKPLPTDHTLKDVFDVVDVKEHTKALDKKNRSFTTATPLIAQSVCWLWKVVEHLHICKKCTAAFVNGEEETSLEAMLDHLFSPNAFLGYLSYRDYGDQAAIKSTSIKDLCPYQLLTLTGANLALATSEVVDWEKYVTQMLPVSNETMDQSNGESAGSVDGEGKENGGDVASPPAKRSRRRPHDVSPTDGRGKGSPEELDDVPPASSPPDSSSVATTPVDPNDALTADGSTGEETDLNAPEVEDNLSEYHGPRMQEMEDYDYNPREDNLPESSPIDNLLREQKPPAVGESDSNRESQSADNRADAVAPEPKAEKDSLQNNKKSTPPMNGKEVISMETPVKVEQEEEKIAENPTEDVKPETSHNSKIKFFEAMKSLILFLDTPSLSEVQSKIHQKIRNIKGSEEVFQNNELIPGFEFMIAKIANHSSDSLPESVESVSLFHVMGLLKAAILNTKLTGLDMLLEKIKGVNEKLSLQTKSIPVKTLARVLQTTIDNIGF